ncbi:MAG: restriction endonuclease subunit S [Desulfobacteraceae bacterium]|nr:restriction endonuclease subunit S [Desulfobacteraceae bacterium]
MNKQLYSRNYPADWDITPLAGFANEGLNSFVDGPFGSDLKVSDYTQSGVRVLQLQNLGDGRFIDDNKIYTSIKKSRQLRRCLTLPGNIIIAKMAEPLARAAIVPDLEEQFLIVADLIKLRVSNIVDPHYLLNFVNFSDFRREAERLSTGTTRTRISLSTLKQISVPKPPLDVQHKIGCIFRSIDESINKTEALLHKYQQIKSGLMHDLFTRGVIPDGKIRPSRGQAPDLYKESPIGWIPIDWNCRTLESLLSSDVNNMRSGPFGSALLKSELVEDGIPFLGIDNIHVEQFIPLYHRFVSVNKFKQLAKYAVREKDVIITIMGTVGRCAITPDDIGQALSSKHLWTMTFNKSVVIPELICWQLNHAEWVKAWFRKETQGGIMDAIQSKTLRTLYLPIPHFDEQLAIFERYNSITDKLKLEQDTLLKLQKQKSGLMNDLLTGNVQVEVDQKEPAHV